MDLVYNTKPKDGLFADKWTGDGKESGGDSIIFPPAPPPVSISESD